MKITDVVQATDEPRQGSADVDVGGSELVGVDEFVGTEELMGTDEFVGIDELMGTEEFVGNVELIGAEEFVGTDELVVGRHSSRVKKDVAHSTSSCLFPLRPIMANVVHATSVPTHGSAETVLAGGDVIGGLEVGKQASTVNTEEEQSTLSCLFPKRLI